MTKEHSKNSVEAKRRLRIARANAEWNEPSIKCKIPRKPKPDFIIRIESARGERMSVSINRFMGKVFVSTGQSLREFTRGLEFLVRKSA